ncbi:hypothetical protein AB4163_05435 [Vibrio splendidus]|uniref:hypothetical protein n=1 Tax=Vibrio splendidus TaxID=29497 RepID=UPI000CC9EB54|nr:hypothetical protein [Vibrio splendidus]PMI52330.1 hypothetical protein BCU42_23950 [Vibrio splendidus]
MKLEEKLVISIYCIILIAFGFLIAVAMFIDTEGATSTDIMSGFGSVLSGFGALGLLWFGCETYSDWKNTKSNEAAFGLYRDLYVFKYKLILLSDNIVKSGSNPRSDLLVKDSFAELESHINALVVGSSQVDSLVKIGESQWFLAHTYSLKSRVDRLLNSACSEHLNPIKRDSTKLQKRSQIVKIQKEEIIEMLQKMECKLNSMGFNPAT